MSLPVITAPTYKVKLISLPKPIKFRPYLVKEEKLLLMAQQGGDATEIEETVKQIVRNCTNDAFDVDKLASFDLEYLFLQLRAKSVNNLVELRFECKNQLPSSEGGTKACGAIVPLSVNLDEVKTVVPEGHTKKIMLTDEVGVTLRYPTAKSYNVLVSDASDILQGLADCLETIFTKEGTVHEVSEQDPAEVQTFIESLSLPHIEKLKAFFDTMPRLSYTMEFKCPKCGYTEDITLSGLQDFFG